MTTSPPPQWRPLRPERAPSRAELAERDLFARRTADSLVAVRASAQTWRTGLTAFITLVTTGVIISGHDTASGLGPVWLILATALIGGGLGLAIVGLWQVLAAEAGSDPQRRTLADIRAAYGTLAAHDVSIAGRSADRLRAAQYIVAAAVVLLLAGVVATWWAPSADTASPIYLKVTYGSEIICGTIQSADGGQLRLAPPGTHEPIVVPLNLVKNLATTTTCP